MTWLVAQWGLPRWRFGLVYSTAPRACNDFAFALSRTRERPLFDLRFASRRAEKYVETRRIEDVMKHLQRTVSTWVIVGTLLCSVLSSGCEPLNWFGNNLSANVVVPLGLAGTPGLFNPFGIVQALVNAVLGVSGSSGGSSAYETPAAAAAAADSNSPAVPVLLD